MDIFQNLGKKMKFKTLLVLSLSDKGYSTCNGMNLETERLAAGFMKYSHALHNDILANDGPYIQQWSHNIIIEQRSGKMAE